LVEESIELGVTPSKKDIRERIPKETDEAIRPTPEPTVQPGTGGPLVSIKHY